MVCRSSWDLTRNSRYHGLILGTPEFRQMSQELVKRARNLVDEAGIKAPPVDPRVLARLRGIKRIVTSDALGFSGQLFRDGDELVIKLSAEEPVERQNFSCCHEIAHTFAFDDIGVRFRMTPATVAHSSSSAEEYLCDRAAAEMLMPGEFFKPLAASLNPSITSVVSLSKLFVSSIRATVVRLGQTGVWPVVFIAWKFTNRLGSSPKLRVSWAVRPEGYRCFIPRHAPAHPATGIYATFLGSHPTFENELLDLGTLRGKYLVESAKFGDYVVSIVHDPKLRRGA